MAQSTKSESSSISQQSFPTLRPPPPLDLSSSNLSEAWRLWKRGYQTYFDLYEGKNLSEQRKVDLLVNAIGGVASICFPWDWTSDIDKCNHDAVLRCYEEYCDPRRHVLVERVNFISTQRDQGETAAKFVERLRSSAKYCEFLEADNFIRDKLIASYPEKSMLFKMITENDLSLDNMIRIALTAEEITGNLKENQDDKPTEVGWDFDAEIKMQQTWEELIWIDNPLENEASLDAMLWKMMKTWMKEDNVKLSMGDETTFCDQSVLKGVLSGKSEHDCIDIFQISRARKRSCPFETSVRSQFENRSFMKMANLDQALGYLFTKSWCTNVLPEPIQTFYFAEICAGNGGFREYVSSKGFKFEMYSMEQNNEVKLKEFKAESSDKIHCRRNENIYDDGNQQEFEKYVMERTNNKGVHLAISDGGISIEGQENIPEIVFHRLYLCQCLMALTVLRKGGNFVCKLFDMFTPFTVGLVYLVSFCFGRIAIFKPVTSRPSSSERYLVCHGKRDNCNSVVNYLRCVNLRMSEIYPGSNSIKMISEIVPIDQLISDKIFYNYIKKTNDRLGGLQIMYLRKIKTFVENPHIRDSGLEYFESSHSQKFRG